MKVVVVVARESVQEVLGFSLFELVFSHAVQRPLKLLKERCLCQRISSCQTNTRKFNPGDKVVTNYWSSIVGQILWAL